MPRLTPVKHDNLVKRLRKFNFSGPYPGGKHLFMIKDDIRLTIPNPHRKEIGVALLKRILKQAGISTKEWVERA